MAKQRLPRIARAATLGAGMLLAIAGIQPATGQSPDAAKGATGGDLSLSVPNLWMASNLKGNWLFTPPEGDLGIVVIDIPQAAGPAEAVTKAWEKLGEDPENTVRLIQPLADTPGWADWLAANPDVAFDAEEILRGMAFRKGTGWTVVIVRGSGFAADSRRFPPAIMLSSQRPPASGR